MMRRLRDFRLLPVVLFAAGCLLTLKVFGLIADGGYTLGAGHLAKTDREAILARRVAQAQFAPPASSSPPRQRSWAQEAFNYPDVTGSIAAAKSSDKTGEADTDKPTGAAGDKPAGKPADKPAAKPEKPAPAKSDGKPGTVTTTPPVEFTQQPSAAERALLQRLQQRHQELEVRARELELRETLLKAAEQKLEARINELKEQEARVNAAMQKKEETEAARFKGLVTMYETMKAKDAAKIFDRLDMKVLMDVASHINPRRMSDIMAQMSPEAAERLTIEMANRAGAPPAAGKTPQPSELPKIEGRPKGG